MATTPKAPKVPGTGAQSTPLPETPTTADNADMPNAVDIDVKLLTAPLLTRQGWLVPPPAPKL